MLSAPVLILNRSFTAVHVCTAKRAFCLIAKGAARALSTDFRLMDMDEWIAQDIDDENCVSTPSRKIPIPEIIVLIGFDRLPRRQVRYSRRNIYLRDRGNCAYCGRHGSMDEMNLDHIVPRVAGGLSNFDNVVLSCYKCNTIKADKTLEQSGMQLLRKPSRPIWTALAAIAVGVKTSWTPFLPHLQGTK